MPAQRCPKKSKRQSTKPVKIIVEKHSDGYVAYPLGLKGVVVGEGNSCEEAMKDVKSAIRFHIETFGKDARAGGIKRSGSLYRRGGGQRLMAKFPGDAPKRRVIRASRADSASAWFENMSTFPWCAATTLMAR